MGNCEDAGLETCGSYACCDPSYQECTDNTYCSTKDEASCENRGDGYTFCPGSLYNSCCHPGEDCVTTGSIPNCIPSPEPPPENEDDCPDGRETCGGDCCESDQRCCDFGNGYECTFEQEPYSKCREPVEEAIPGEAVTGIIVR
ncbi:MAG: hypothetical protein ABH864_00460 [archaeon]